MVRKFLLATYGICLLSCVKAQDKWDLKRVVSYALANNISVKQADVQARITELQYKLSKLGQYPLLNFSGNAGYSSGRNQDPTTFSLITVGYFFNNYTLQSSAEVFNWFTKKNTVIATDFDTRAAYASVDKLRNDIALNVAGYYLQALLNIETVKVSEVKIEQTKAQLENTRKLVEAGSLPQLNLAQLEAQLATDSSTLITAKGTVIQANLSMKALLTLDAALPFDLDTPPVESIPVENIADLQPEGVFQLALANLPQQKINDFKVKAAQKYVQAAKGAMYPVFSIFGSIGTTYNDKATVVTGFSTFTVPIGKVNVNGSDYSVFPLDPFTRYNYGKSTYYNQLNQNLRQSVGISVSVPILNGGNYKISYERSKLNLKNAELQLQLDQQTLKQDIYKAYTDASVALQKFNAAKKTVEANQIAYDFASKRYEVGLLNTIDLLTSQNNLFTAKINMLSAQFEYVFKMKVLEFYKGQGIKL